ncbi:MAG TPA: hypothetical protein VF808_16600 [Ktedonobacterales bacterium]
MQDPTAVLDRARRGDSPEGWSVMRPPRSYPTQMAFGGCFLTPFLSIVVLGFATFAALAVWSAFFGGRRQEELFSPDPAFLARIQMVVVAVVAVVVVIAVVVALTMRARAARDLPWSCLVYLPDGLVQALGPETVVALDYAALDDVAKEVTVYRVRNQQTGIWSTRVSTTAALLYPDGHTTNWSPDSRFGSHVDLVARLVNGYKRYHAQGGQSGAQRGVRLDARYDPANQRRTGGGVRWFFAAPIAASILVMIGSGLYYILTPH